MIFASEKRKTAKDLLKRKSLLLPHLLLAPYYNFYKQNSKKLAVALESTSLSAIFYGRSDSQPVATPKL